MPEREGYTQHRDPQRLTPGTATSEAARRAKMTLTGFVSALRAAAGLGIEVDWSHYRPRQYLAPPPGAPMIPANDHLVEDQPDGEPVTICVIGDAHDSPHLPDKSRFKWLGDFASEHGVDRIVQIGDWWTMDCFSTHADRATIEGRSKPTFDQDRDSFHHSMRAFHDGRPERFTGARTYATLQTQSVRFAV